MFYVGRVDEFSAYAILEGGREVQGGWSSHAFTRVSGMLVALIGRGATIFHPNHACRRELSRVEARWLSSPQTSAPTGKNADLGLNVFLYGSGTGLPFTMLN